MGCGISKGDLKAVQDGTNMTAAEVKEAYKAFKKENKTDKVDLQKFTKLVASMNTNKGKPLNTLFPFFFFFLVRTRGRLSTHLVANWSEV